MIKAPQHIAGKDLGPGETQVISLCLQDLAIGSISSYVPYFRSTLGEVMPAAVNICSLQVERSNAHEKRRADRSSRSVGW